MDFRLNSTSYIPLLVACLLAFSCSARPDDVATSLTLQRVKLADAACGQACPEWVSVQGPIALGDAERLRKALDALGPRKIPLLIHSNGGLVEEALEMGRMVREKGLQVGVARTTIAQCIDPAGCHDVRGSFATLDATCFSACTLVLAGGVDRFATPLTHVGVHQMRNTASRTVVERLYRETYEIVNGVERLQSRELVNSETRIVAPSTPDFERLKQKVRLYLTDMRIDEKVWTLAMETPANEIFNLHPADLRALRLITSSVAGDFDAERVGDDTRLKVVDAGPPTAPAGTLDTTGVWPLLRPIHGRHAALEATFAFALGTQTIEGTFVLRDLISRAALGLEGRGLVVTLANKQFRVDHPYSTAPLRLSIPAQDFCLLKAVGTIAVACQGSSAHPGKCEGAAPLPLIDPRASPGASALFNAACQ